MPLTHVPIGFASDIVNAQSTWKGTSNGSLLTDHAASYIAGIAMEGASDTQSNTLAGFIKVCPIASGNGILKETN